MSKADGTFLENIHLADYTAQYRKKKLVSEDLISDYYRPKESLSGMWRFCVDQYDTCLRAKWFEEHTHDEDGRPLPLDFSFDTWETIKVPSCWNMHSERLFLYEGPLVYTRCFRYVNHGEKRVFIKFGGAAYEAYVFVNRKYMGMHEGASTPFIVEVTDVLEGENRILVVVNNTRRRTNVPCENTDWFNYGGLYRDVDLLRLPETFIKDFTLSLTPDMKSIRATVRTSGPDSDSGSGSGSNSGSNSGSGSDAVLSIEELGLRTTIAVRGGFGEATIEANPVLWSPDSPKLYDISIEYGGDTLRDRVGFRDIKVQGTDIFLNGESLLLKGVCAHEESVHNGKSVSEFEVRENFRLAKELNCNYMRLAHYPHSEAAARIADEMGILLWEEIPVYWAIEFDNEDVYLNAENQLKELITRDRNRASVIIWSVGNENADTDSRLKFMSSLAKAARAHDHTRLVSAACLVDNKELRISDRLAEDVDVIGINEYYGWYEPDFSKLIKIFDNSAPSKPVVISEYGADARAGFRGTKDDLMTEDNQLYVYERQIEVFKKTPYVKGTSPWILFDFRCPRRTHSVQNYYNIKGLLCADKSYKKLAYYAMQEFYATWGSP